jgi:hypothetical protein
MAMPYPTCLYWGPSHTIIYNEQWIKIAQNKNPYILGKGFAEGWPELQGYFLPLLRGALHHGKSFVKRAEQLFLNRGDWVEECYFDFTISAVVGESGTPEGVLEQAFELTRHAVSLRRMETLDKMGALLAPVQGLDEDGFWRKVLEAFQDNPLDSPFALIYRTLVDGDGSRERCVLEGGIGFTDHEGRAFAPEKYDLRECCGLFSDEMARARETNSAVIKHLDGIPYDQEFTHRGFSERPTNAAVIPIQATDTLTQGFLILGLNPRRPVDADYILWIELLRKELATAVGRVRLLKAEVTRAVEEECQRASNKQAIDLQKQLEERTVELGKSELLFTKVCLHHPPNIHQVVVNR